MHYASIFSLVILLAAPLIWIICVLLRRQIGSAKNKAVLITGCDRGFGFLVAQKLDQLGYHVLAGCLDADGEGAALLKQNTSSNLLVIQLDVTSDEEIAAAREQVETFLQEGNKCLWAVVNNAGIASFEEAEWTSLKTYHDVMNINYLGVVRVTKSFLPLIRAAKGRMVNIVSFAGRVAIPGSSAYSASKFAVVGFSDSIRREMKKFEVDVICIEPAMYRTALVNIDSIVQQNVQEWNQAPAEVRHAYGEGYFRNFLTSMTKFCTLKSRQRLNEVTDDIVHAVAAKHPFTRYVPGLWWIEQLAATCFSIMPNRFQDFILASVIKMSAKPALVGKSTV